VKIFSSLYNIRKSVITLKENPPACRQAGKCSKIKQIFKNIASPKGSHIKVSILRHFIPLPNLFSSLARRFACCQSCSVSLRTLWAYGFDSAAPRALEKLRLVRKKNILFPSTNSIF